MRAGTLNCPNCGAAVSSDASQCRYCESKLATIACPSCFGRIFAGSKFCDHCGAAAVSASAAALSVLKCPRCRVDMSSVTIGAAQMRECERCEGLWVETGAFESICSHQEQQSAVLGAATLAPANHAPQASDAKVRYVPCPQCGQLMNRINFAKCSNVIVDVCKGHGTWFDRDELRQIVEFIRGGGMEASRQKLLHEIEFQRAQLRAEEQKAVSRTTWMSEYPLDDERLGGLSAASGLLKFLLK
ncbi:MAG TPA: zf-TFIIB domain-containing protein [Pyrinomonadaceae bacterium]|nr:zf-TFIIB domain-containing protein [Pyrinomonadaceae bacterium]